MAHETRDPSTMQRTGDELLSAAEESDLTAVKPRFERFRRAHGAWSKAQLQKEAAAAREAAARNDLGELDAAVDIAVDTLAVSLIADGFARTRPFKVFNVPVPAAIKKLAQTVEARTCLKLAAAVAKHPDAGAASKAAAKALTRAAQALLNSAKRVPDAATKTHIFRKNRDALIQEWGKSLALLRDACRLVEDDGGEALYTKLFKRDSGGNHKPKAAPAVAPPAATPSGPEPTPINPS